MKLGQMKDSKYIKKEDVGETGKNLTISELKNENIAGEDRAEDMKWILYFKEAKKGMVANWTNLQILAKVTGSEESDDWTGKVVNVYEDPMIDFGGKIVGGIRIRKASGGSNQGEQTAPVEAAPVPNNEFDDSIPF